VYINVRNKRRLSSQTFLSNHPPRQLDTHEDNNSLCHPNSLSNLKSLVIDMAGFPDVIPRLYAHLQFTRYIIINLASRTETGVLRGGGNFEYTICMRPTKLCPSCYTNYGTREWSKFKIVVSSLFKSKKLSNVSYT
jgi:hypothetical protein